MKRDHKPFVVEVKRGTRRSSFLGSLDPTTTMSEAQRRAEQALFAPAAAEPANRPVAAEPSRRILPSLIEPAPIVEEEDAAAAERRPRPVGRPRKPKPPVTHDAFDAVQPTFMARAPEAVAPSAAPSPLPPRAVPAEAQDRRTGSPPMIADPEDPPAPVPAEGRQRLRDRSSILARYVLGTAPAPGQRWLRSPNRSDRRGRSSD